MPDVLEERIEVEAYTPAPPGTAHPHPRSAPDEHPARRSLLDQVERLESELTSLFVSAWPRGDCTVSVPGRGGPCLLSLAELEELRDDLAHRAEDARRSLAERTRVEEQNRRRIEEMLLEPERHKWVRIANQDIGEPGCKHWHVLPRWGLLGMLMNWWRVRVSSGCPLPEGHRGSR